MPCYHPLDAWFDFDYDRTSRVFKFKLDVNTGKRMIRFGIPPDGLPDDFKLHLPCGKCVGCRLDYSRQWANRCMLELQYHDSSYFVTLTYDDAHVPVNYYPDPETGEAMPACSLCKRDFQLFMKRLRKRFGDDHIRFFAAGEYGSTTFRPHYHAIIFGLHLNDLKVYKRSPQGFTYYNSPSLQSCWCDKQGNPIGFAVAAEVSWETCAYTARYVMKKLHSDCSMYANFGLEPEFSLMSRRPGIARQYYDDHPDLYERKVINIATEKGGKQFYPPRYFDRLFDLEHPDESAALKASRRKLAEEATKLRLAQTSLSEHDMLEVMENSKVNAIKSLRRNLE